MRRVLVLFVAFSAIAVLAVAAPQKGAAAPDLGGTDDAGAAVSLQQFKGKVVLVNFWASWCPPCLRELPLMDAMAGDLEKKNVVVLAINLDDEAAKGKAMAKRLGLKHVHVVYDPQKRSPARLSIEAMPTSVIVDKYGTIRFVNEGYRNGDMAKMKAEIEKLLL